MFFLILTPLLILGCLSPIFLYAATIDVTAEYKPGMHEQGQARFVNTTVCVTPGIDIYGCNNNVERLNVFFSVPINITRAASGPQNGPENAFFYVKGPSKTKTVTLTSSSSSQRFDAQLLSRWLGATYESHDNGFYEPSITPIFTEAFRKLDGGCRYITGNRWPSRAAFVWSQWDIGDGVPCYGTIVQNSVLPSTISHLIYGFLVDPPNPLTMPNGVYRGTIVLSLGPTNNSDISYGHGTYNTNQLVINLTLTVRHQIKVDFPPGSQNIVLQPPGGWSQWIYGRRNPPRSLEQKLPFNISASADYEISTACQYSVGMDYCALKNTKNEHLVKLETFYEQRDTSGVSLLELPVRVPISNPTDHQRNIMFKVSGSDIPEMMKYPGSTYKGTVTLIIDASI